MKKLFALLMLLPLLAVAEDEPFTLAPVFEPDDLAWLMSRSAVQVGLEADQVPLAFSTGDQALAGTYVDYLKRIGARLPVPLTLVPDARDGLEASLADGSLDAVLRTRNAGEVGVPERLDTSPLMTLTYGLFVDAGDAGIRRLSDLEGQRVALLGNDRHQYELLDPVESFVPVPVNNVAEAVSMVLSGQADAFIGPLPVVSDYLQSALISGVGLATTLDRQPIEVVLSVPASQPQLYRVLEQVVTAFTHQEHREIREAWAPFVVPEAGSGDGIRLSRSEQEWLERNSGLTVAYRSEWPPFEFEQDGQWRGLVPDLVERLEQELDTSFNARASEELGNPEEALRNGEVDILPALSRTPRREGEFLFTRSYLSLPIALAIRDEGRFIGDLQELQDERVGVVRQHASHEFLLINHPELNLYPVTSMEEGLLALSNGDLDVMVTHIPGISYTVARLGLSNLRITSITPYQYELRLAVRKDQPELLRILNKALRALDESETDAIHNRWINLDVEPETDYTGVRRVVLIALVVVLIFLYWNRKLSREVDERIRSENALRRSEDDLRAAKLEAERLAREAESANRAKSEFLANMSHEIRTPMNAVIGYSDLLNNSITDPRQRQYVDAIRAGSRSLLMLINDILDLSRIEAGKMRLEFNPLNLRRLLEDVRHIFALRAGEQGVALEVSVTEGLPEAMVLDETRLRQVLFNLVGNAIKFTHEGQVTVTAAATPVPRKPGEPARCELVITVKDTGIGIAENQQERIFDAFEQQEGQSSRKYGGTGLGLAISRKLARMMGGELSVASTPGQGSTFTVTLPAVEVARARRGGEKETGAPERPMIDTLNLHERSWLKGQLKRDFGDEWQSVRESGDPEQMRDFAGRLLAWAQRYRSQVVMRYAEKLTEQVDTFDLDAINETLAAFPQLLGRE